MKQAAFFFIIGLIFFGASFYFLKNSTPKSDTAATSFSRTFLLAKRSAAISEAKKNGVKNYQFEISSPSFSPLYFNNVGNQK